MLEREVDGVPDGNADGVEEGEAEGAAEGEALTAASSMRGAIRLRARHFGKLPRGES